MPELLEVETYRGVAAGSLRRPIREVRAPDDWFVKGATGPPALVAALEGRCFVAARRVGKLLLLDTDGAGPTLGVRFGMTGVLELDDDPAIDRLQYGSGRRDPAWVRFSVGFDDGGELVVRDPRRLGGVELDPDEGRLGVDAAVVGAAALGRLLDGGAGPLKARLMDQSRLAGLGNLLTDELLWRAGLDPARPAGSLEPPELRRLHRHLRRTLAELGERGGSHTGDLQPARTRGGVCPRDGTPLLRRRVAGRTTYSCPLHQR